MTCFWHSFDSLVCVCVWGGGGAGDGNDKNHDKTKRAAFGRLLARFISFSKHKQRKRQQTNQTNKPNTPNKQAAFGLLVVILHEKRQQNNKTKMSQPRSFVSLVCLFGRNGETTGNDKNNKPEPTVLPV